MEVIKRRLSRMFSKDSSEAEIKNKDEFDFYSYPPYAKHQEKHQLFFKASKSERFKQDVIISGPSRAYEPIHSLTISGLGETWRLAIDESGEKIYSTNNNAENAMYKVLTLKKDGDKVLRSVQCQHICKIRGIAVDGSNNVYVSGDHKIQKYNAEDQLVASFGWAEPGSEWYQCNDPNGVFFYQGRVYVCDSRNKRIQILSATDLAYISSIGGGGGDGASGGGDGSDCGGGDDDGGDGDDDNGGGEDDEDDGSVVGGSSCLVHPEDMDIDTGGNLHIVDSGNQSVVVFDSHGIYSRTVALPENEVEFPVSLRIVNGHYYISDLSKSHIGVFTFAGKYLHKVLIQSRAEMEEDEDGFVYVVAGVLQRPIGMAVDKNGIIYICNLDSEEIQIF